MKNILLLISLLMFVPIQAIGEEKVSLIRVFLYQPNIELKKRLTDQNAFTTYVSQVRDIVISANVSNEEPKVGSIVFAISPKGEVKFWTVFDEGLSNETILDIKKRVSAIKVPNVKIGPVAFALSVSILNAGGEIVDLPTPERWLDESRKIERPIEASELIVRAWKSGY